jgi:DNA-directed RNA polymerase subunit RPC12/RpoP
MLTEEISLVCRHCGGPVVSSLSWAQAHRHFRCPRCGRLSTLDKDRLSLVLAGQTPPAAAVARSSSAAVPMRLDAKEKAADLSRLPIYGA